jgi:hypothetical protein
MTEEKKNSAKKKTKAGTKQKIRNRTVHRKIQGRSEKDPENTPKISKKEVDHQDNEPLH